MAGSDAGSVFVREEFSVEHRHDRRVEIMVGTSSFDQGDRHRRIEAQRELRAISTTADAAA